MQKHGKVAFRLKCKVLTLIEESIHFRHRIAVVEGKQAYGVQ